MVKAWLAEGEAAAQSSSQERSIFSTIKSSLFHGNVSTTDPCPLLAAVQDSL